MLTAAEYQQAIWARGRLEGLISTKTTELEEMKVVGKRLRAEINSWEAQLLLYTNFLGDAIEEYEAAQPKEPQP